MSERAKKGRQWQYTHQTIIQQAICLAKEHGWEKVRVTKLVELANINRNSFYLHFETINDVFDEIEESFLSKYKELLESSPLDEMIKDSKNHAAFYSFWESEREYIATINKIGRTEIFLSKMSKIWMNHLDVELSKSQKYEKQKEIILPYISGATLLFFTNWFNDPMGFEIEKNGLFSTDFIDQSIRLFNRYKFCRLYSINHKAYFGFFKFTRSKEITFLRAVGADNIHTCLIQRLNIVIKRFAFSGNTHIIEKVADFAG